MTAAGGGSQGAIVAVGVVFAIVWLCLPFAVFGVKARLDRQARLLAAILAQLKENGGDDD